MSAKTQRGQALILIAVSFVGLAAFIGLAMDAGILFVTNGHLRRAVDAAAMAASMQFRRDTTQAEFEATVDQTLRANRIDVSAANVRLGVCYLGGTPNLSAIHDTSLCPGGANNPSAYNRKLVRVNAELPVRLAFLPVIGLATVTLQAEAVSEAASVDLILVVDTSESMAVDSGAGFPACNANNSCYPFEHVRQAARAFIQEMYYPYDRVSLVHFDTDGYAPDPFLTNAEADLLNRIGETGGSGGLRLLEMGGCWNPSNPSGCLSTNTAGGLREAGNALSDAANGGREEALWVVVLLSDGAANQAQDIRSVAQLPSPDPNARPDGSHLEYLCPNEYLASGTPPASVYPLLPTQQAPSWIPPYCRDGRFGGYASSERHRWDSPWYDVEDFTRDMADQLGCYQLSNPDASDHCRTYDGGLNFGDGKVADGYEALLFAIGIGPQVTFTNCADAEPGSDDTGVWNTYYDDSTPARTCRNDLGEQLLRYVAAAGDDGDPSTDPCASTPSGNDCGNYYYRSDASNLGEVFSDIAKRIYTKITH